MGAIIESISFKIENLRQALLWGRRTEQGSEHVFGVNLSLGLFSF